MPPSPKKRESIFHRTLQEISTGDTRNEKCSILLHCHLTHRKPLTLMRKLPKLFMKAILLTRLMAMLSEGGVRLLNASRRRCRYIGSVWCCSNWLTKSRYPSWKKTPQTYYYKYITFGQINYSKHIIFGKLY